MARHGARGRALVLATGLALATSLAACSGAADEGAPAGATETAASPAVSTEPPATAPPSAPATPGAGPETAHPPTAPPDPPLPELPAESGDPGPLVAPLPNGEPVPLGMGAPEPPTAPGDPAVQDPADPPEDPTAAVAETLPTTTLTYGAPNTTGTVTDDGDYAFLSDPDDLTSAITTYKGLRTGLRDGTTIGLVMHQNDSAGTSQADFYDLVQTGDVVEWREADGCWMRYVITEVHPDPTDVPPRKLLTIRVYSYPYPDTGCTGALRTTGSRTFTWTPELMRTGNFTVPFHHGPFLIAPRTWSEDLPETVSITPPVITWPPDSIPNPNLGNGWSGGTFFGYGGRLEGFYRHEDGGTFIISIFQVYRWPDEVQRIGGVGADLSREFANEYRVIDGLPAWVSYEYTLDDMSRAVVVIYDPANGVMYSASGGTVAQRNDPEATIALLRKFLLDTP